MRQKTLLPRSVLDRKPGDARGMETWRDSETAGAVTGIKSILIKGFVRIARRDGRPEKSFDCQLVQLLVS